MNCSRMFGWLAHFFYLLCLAGGIGYPNLCVCTCMCMVNPLLSLHGVGGVTPTVADRHDLLIICKHLLGARHAC